MKDWLKKAIEEMGNDINKTGTPDCYKPNTNPYPLCIGNGNDYCKDCCLYENMIEPEYY